MFTADPSVSVMKCRTLSPLSHLRFLLPLCSQFQLCTISVSCHFDFHHLFVGLLEHSPSLCCTVTTFTVFVSTTTMFVHHMFQLHLCTAVSTSKDQQLHDD